MAPLNDDWMSDYRIRITHVTGRDATLIPGGQGERDLVDAVTDKALARGVGVFKTEAQVKAAITDAFREVLRELKTEVQP